MSRFIVFDVETPNRYCNRICAIGIAVIEDGVIVDEFYSLVNPETSFDYFNVRAGFGSCWIWFEQKKRDCGIKVLVGTSVLL